jgi:hypothetical protein
MIVGDLYMFANMWSTLQVSICVLAALAFREALVPMGMVSVKVWTF